MVFKTVVSSKKVVKHDYLKANSELMKNMILAALIKAMIVRPKEMKALIQMARAHSKQQAEKITGLGSKATCRAKVQVDNKLTKDFVIIKLNLENNQDATLPPKMLALVKITLGQLQGFIDVFPQ